MTADIVQAIREVRPEIVCTFGPGGAMYPNSTNCLKA